VTALLALGLFACSGSATSADSGKTAPSDTGTDTPTTDDSGTTDSAPECPPADTTGDGVIAEACCDTSPSLQIWGGQGEAIDMEPGSDLPITYSPQYGWELQLFPKLCGTRDVITIEVLLTDTETGHVLQQATEAIAIYRDAEGSCCQDGWLVYDTLDVTGINGFEAQEWATTLCGRGVRVALSATDWDRRTSGETLDLVFSADEEALGHACGESPPPDTDTTGTGTR
jgi:hypothetical protein